MSWQEVDTMSLRSEFVALASGEGANVRRLCRRFSISPKTAYKWLARSRVAGAASLADRSRRPRHSPHQTDATVEQKVLAIRAAHPRWGGRKLRRRLGDLGHADVPAASTITAILRRHGQLGPTAGPPRDHQRFEAAAANERWQMDFKGHFAMNAGRCHPLTVLDDHSRYSLGLVACGDERHHTAKNSLIALFRRYGLPATFLCANGPPWGSAGADEPYTAFSVWLMRLGIRVGHGRPYHPQTQGQDERFHRTLNIEVLQGRTFRDLADCQRRFDDWRPIYHEQRPHEALDLAVPASRYRVSERSYPEQLPALQYHDSDVVRKVADDGTISFQGSGHKIGKAFRGQAVAVRPTPDDGVWQAYFGAIAATKLDLRTTPHDR